MNLKSVRDRLLELLGKFHLRIFRQPMSQALEEFFDHISWSMVGLFISSVFLMIGRLLAGRFLGPTEFGKINLIFTITQFFFVFSLFGLDRVSLRYIARVQNKLEKSAHISTAFYTIVAFFSFFSLVYILILPLLSSFLEVNTTLLLVTLIYGGCLIMRQIFNAFIRGLEAFKYQAVTQSVEAMFSVFLFLIFYWIWPVHDYFIYLISLIVPSLFFSSLAFIKIRSYIALTQWNREAFSKYFEFCRVYFLSLVFFTLFTSLDKFLISKYLGLRELGIYSAYFSASFLVIAQLNTIISNVFFPTLSKHDRYLHSILKKIDRLMIIGFLPAFCVFSFLTFIIVKLFGADYPIRLDYIVGFSLIALFNTMVSINGSFAQVHAQKTLSRILFWNNFSNVLLMGVYGLWVYYEMLSIRNVIFVLIMSYVIAFFIYKFILYKEGAYRASPMEAER